MNNLNFSISSTEQELAEALPDAIVILDAQQKILWWNRQASKFFSLDEEKIGEAITDIISHPDFIRYVQKKKNWNNELEIPAPRRTNARISLKIVSYTASRYLLIANDITHLYQLERVRQDFIANVSHELRTPLTVLKGYLETLIYQLPDVETTYKPLFLQMQQQANRIENLVTDLLLLARLETDLPEMKTLQPIAVSSLILSICTDADSLSQQQHKINTKLDRKLYIYGNSNELRSAFSNLIFNAVRYTPPGGKINVRWFSDEQGAHLQVQDTGIGIEAKHIPRLTERFYRVDEGRSRDVGGTGLGLAIVKHVLIRHQGELKVSSVVGKGSMFQCDFPAARIVREERT